MQPPTREGMGFLAFALARQCERLRAPHLSRHKGPCAQRVGAHSKVADAADLNYEHFVFGCAVPAETMRTKMIDCAGTNI